MASRKRARYVTGMSEPADDPPVPRLPRGRGMTLDRGMLLRIGMTVALLVAILVTARPCADATSKFVTDFDSAGSGSGSAATAMPHPGTVDVPAATPPTSLDDYEVLRPGMTDAEVKAVIERAKAKAKAASGSGSTP